MDYQFVGAFVCEHEKTNVIKEGLQIPAGWNPGWNPLYFMTDFDEKELNAIKSVFTSYKVYLCDFHLEQAWTRWVSKKEHRVSHVKDDVLARFILIPFKILRVHKRIVLLEQFFQQGLNGKPEHKLPRTCVTIPVLNKKYVLRAIDQILVLAIASARQTNTPMVIMQYIHTM
eukprot:gene2439-2806_t